MTEPDNNPFASPAIASKERTDATAVAREPIGRWLTVATLSGIITSAFVISIVGFVLLCLVLRSAGVFGKFFLEPDGSLTMKGIMEMGRVLLALALFGGLFGGLSGFFTGSVAYRLRGDPRHRFAITLLGYLLPLVFVWGLVLCCMAISIGLPDFWRLAAVLIFLPGCLLIGWRVNYDVRVHLLSRQTGAAN